MFGDRSGRLAPAVGDLQRLDEVFRVHQAPRAVLGVDRAGLDELLDLEATHPEAAVQVERFGAVDEAVAERLDLGDRARVARDGAELDQRLPLVAPGWAARAVILVEGRQRGGRRPAPAVRPEPEIDVERPAPAAVEHPAQGRHETVEVAPRRPSATSRSA